MKYLMRLQEYCVAFVLCANNRVLYVCEWDCVHIMCSSYRIELNSFGIDDMYYMFFCFRTKGVKDVSPRIASRITHSINIECKWRDARHTLSNNWRKYVCQDVWISFRFGDDCASMMMCDVCFPLFMGLCEKKNVRSGKNTMVMETYCFLNRTHFTYSRWALDAKTKSELCPQGNVCRINDSTEIHIAKINRRNVSFK